LGTLTEIKLPNAATNISAAMFVDPFTTTIPFPIITKNTPTSSLIDPCLIYCKGGEELPDDPEGDRLRVVAAAQSRGATLTSSDGNRSSCFDNPSAGGGRSAAVTTGAHLRTFVTGFFLTSILVLVRSVCFCSSSFPIPN